MILIVLAMLAIVMLAASVVLFVAFPQRGQQVPHAPWLDQAMQKVVGVLPTPLEPEDPPRG